MAHMVLACRICKKTHDDDQCKKTGHTLFQRSDAEKGGIHAVKRKCDHDETHDDSGLALPDSGVGLLVIFAHQFFNIFCSAYVNMMLFGQND